MVEKLKKSLIGSDVVKRGSYYYFVNPLTSGVHEVNPDLMKEICESIISLVEIKNVDIILTIESMGIHIAAVLSQMTGIPFNIVRKKSQQTSDEIVLKQITGYGISNLYMTLPENKKVLIIDSVISTGGTLIAVINGLKKLNTDIIDIICVIERGDGVKIVKDKTGYNVKTLEKIDIKDNKVVLI
jgi:adenine phosphoribosyltransferase